MHPCHVDWLVVHSAEGKKKDLKVKCDTKNRPSGVSSCFTHYLVMCNVAQPLHSLHDVNSFHLAQCGADCFD